MSTPPPAPSSSSTAAAGTAPTAPSTSTSTTLPSMPAKPKITFHKQPTSLLGHALPASSDYPLNPLEWEYATAQTHYRNREYDRCVDVCNVLLLMGLENNVQLFSGPPPGADEAGGGGIGGGVGGSGQHRNQHQHQSYSKHSRASYGGQRYSSNLPRISSGGGGFGGGASRQSANATGGGGGGGGTANRSATGGVGGTAPAINMPTWLMEGVWLLKMSAQTQRVYVDDLETFDADDLVNEELELGRMATAARPGTSIKTAISMLPRVDTAFSGGAGQRPPGTAAAPPRGGNPSGSLGNLRIGTGRPMSSRPTSAMTRPGTATSRPGSAFGNRPATRCGTASRVRSVTAAAYNVDDPTAVLYQAARLNPTIYAERSLVTKPLFRFLFYHESNVQKAYQLCEAVKDVAKKRRHRATTDKGTTNASMSPKLGVDDWWWDQQLGRCLLTLRRVRLAEGPLQASLASFQHPDTYLLLSRVYQRMDQPDKALALITGAVDKSPFNVVYRLEQGRIFDVMSKPDDAFQIYRLIAKLNPINIEALASIAMHYFYDNNPEMALMYYKRILSLDVHNSEVYCNIGLCCLYGGQLDLVMPCFKRATSLAVTVDQKADIWYNLSFVAITTGDFKLAHRCLQLCLSGDANNGAALNNLAVLAAHRGDLMKAKLFFNAAKEVLTECYELENNLKYMDEHYKL